MFFKRIEMTGFKSFATKTTVEFREGVTIVVGPNGCGKSNIFDAIRWVLGEQSARSLRGQKMGDVIFNGSATYRPMGCAQVTLVIDNENGRLPIDFSEISLARRLYRSGESEYLINKTPCRLRDIQDLFLDTGVGTESYSVMEQGRVAEIIRSRPEERRHLFEEAAGVAKYRARKNEALRKLERTEQDLIRLADRIAESRTRCISLKRQAAKAERYKGLRDAADAIRMRLLAARLRHVRSDLEKIEKTYAEAQDRVAVARAQYDMLEARREELELRMTQADQTVQDLIHQKEDHRLYINECSNEIVRLSGQAEAEQRRVGDLDRQIEDLKVRAHEIAVNLAEANAEEARLAVRSIALQARLNERRAEYERLRADSETTFGEMHRLRKSLQESADQAMRIENQRTQAALLMEQGRKAIGEFERQRKEHTEAVERLNAEIAEHEKKLEARGQDLARLESERAQTRENLRAEINRRDGLRIDHRRAEQSLREARTRLEALERLALDYEGYYAGVKAVMLAANEKRLDGVVGVVPELIQSIDPKHDTAIEVALGNHVQDIVVRLAENAKRAIELLKSTGGGSATFLPLDLLSPKEIGRELRDVLSQTGVIGLASQLVTFDQTIAKAVQELLGRTIVTEHIDVSLALTRGGKRHRYVTLEGDLMFPSGAITGGSRRLSGIMIRQREIAELGQRSSTLQAAEADLAARLQACETSIVDLEARQAQQQEGLSEARLDLGRAETQLAAMRESRDQRAALLGDLDRRAQANGKELEIQARRLDECIAQLGAIEEQSGSLREKLALMEEALFGRKEEVDRVGSHVSEMDQEIARLSERQASLRERAETYSDEGGRLVRSSTALRSEQETSTQKARGLAEQAQRLKTERAALENEVAGVEERCRKAIQEKESSQIALHEETRKASALVAELNEASNALNAVQTDRVTIQSDLRHADQEAQERFGRTVDALIEEVGEVEDDRQALVDEMEGLEADLRRMGDNINMHALVEYKDESERYEFLVAQEEDLMKARDSLNEAIETIDKTSRQLFWDAFESIRHNFIEVYRRLFGGGRADLILQEVEDGDPLLDGGVDIVAQPPGKKLQNITLLSGGENALTAVSLMFAIFMYKPSPFCVMDEIDAPLDDVNVVRFREMLREFSERSQFIIITHNKITMELADTLYGITMQETGVSSLVSVDFDQLEKVHADVS
ncbi:chromosome segregation protein SMC [Candidatus Sumerlaeota bacterium]|nr:chromosome segregation protein SMC [Candidatus Sumerlaeota bacterium]